MRGSARRLAGVALAVFACAPVTAVAHVERPAYWPDPAPDRSVKPAAGGKVPKARSLASALNAKPPGNTRVVCKKGSLTALKKSVARARKKGYAIRPSDRRKLSRKQANRLIAVNTKLFKRCRYREIQPAVMASRNNDRVVVMPGLYLEPTARKKPTHDPKCAKYRTDGDRPGNEGQAVSYAYQFHCPNDQNLIAVLGRKLGRGTDPKPPPQNRHGIPNTGPCIRCNLQLEGSGVSADDVVIEAGKAAAGNGGPNGVGSAKDVGVRADRADGFVLRGMTIRHAGEHGIYILESDGYLLDRFKAFYNRLYGTLTFVEDHGVQQNCEAVGHGDSGIYPGAAVETGVQRPPGTPFRYNQEIRWCDLHHNLAGYSGTDGNAVHIRSNNIYDNSLGLQTDVVTASGHPGYPGDSMLVEGNNFYSNNYNVYNSGSDIEPSFPFPVGTGMWIAGGNWHQVRNNRFWDNWRRGTMLFAVPDSLICGPDSGNHQAGCKSGEFSTSHYNAFHDNIMGTRPDGTADPNGTDFWWDQFAGNRGNCWFRNYAPKPITTDPSPLPDCDDGKDPGSSVGTGNVKNQSELSGCLAAYEFDQNGACPWFNTPPEPQPGGGGATMTPGLSALPGVAAATSTQARAGYVPLGQLTCTDWNAAGDAARAELTRRVRAFAGGAVISEDRAIGTGAVLSDTDAARMYDSWCGRDYAKAFLLYKLYTHAAAFARR